jgi:hypothetical protein
MPAHPLSSFDQVLQRKHATCHNKKCSYLVPAIRSSLRAAGSRTTQRNHQATTCERDHACSVVQKLDEWMTIFTEDYCRFESSTYSNEYSSNFEGAADSQQV